MHDLIKLMKHKGILIKTQITFISRQKNARHSSRADQEAPENRRDTWRFTRYYQLTSMSNNDKNIRYKL